MMRSALKLLLLLGVGLFMAGTNKGDGTGPKPGDPNNSGPPKKTPDGTPVKGDLSEAFDGVNTSLTNGQVKDADGDGDPDITTPDTTRKWDADQLADMPNLGNIPDKRQVHILDGEWDYDTGELLGGGHAPGAGNPGKTEFPERWSDEAIMDNISDVARNPGSDPAPRPGGGYRVTGVRDGVEIEVLLNRDGTVWSAYPLGGDGVVFN